MAIDTATPRTRRALLGAALGAAAATVASALGRPLPAAAADGGSVLLGTANAASQPTKITSTGLGTTALQGESTNVGEGVVGKSLGGNGVTGESTSGPGGVFASKTNLGLVSWSEESSGIFGEATAAGQPAIEGRTPVNTGVFGYSGTQPMPDGKPNTGVFGLAEAAGGSGVQGEGPTTGVYGNATNPSGAANGVFGQCVSPAGHAVSGYNGAPSGDAVAGRFTTISPSGRGVIGRSTSTSGENYGVYGDTLSSAGRGVFGRSLAATGGTGAFGQADSPTGIGVRGLAYDSAAAGKYGTGVMGVAGVHDKAAWPPGRADTGVMGHSPTGTGVFASTATGYALRTVGRVRFDRCAGVATVPATKSSVVVTPGIELVGTSAVVATLQGSAGSPTTTVSRCVINATANSFTIHLTATAAQDAKVAWHVFG